LPKIKHFGPSKISGLATPLAPIINLRALMGPPFLVYALSKFYEIFFMIAFLL